MRRTSAAVLLCLCTAVPAAAQTDRIKVTDLKIQGVRAVSEGELKNALATRESSWLPWGEEQHFNRAQFEADLKRIQVFYADRGFPDARVTSFDLNLNQTQDEIAISLVIDEGEPILVEDVRFTGFDALPRRRFQNMREAAPIKPGQPRDRAAVHMTRERALDLFRDQGYPDASVKVEESAGSDARKVVITYAATPGELARFGAIEVVGNTSVSDRVVERHLTFRPGWRFRLSQMQESQRRLYSLELFEFVNVERFRTRAQDEGSGRGFNAGVQDKGSQRGSQSQDTTALSEATGTAATPSSTAMRTTGAEGSGQATPGGRRQRGNRAAQEGNRVPVRVTVTEGKHRRLNLGVGYGSEERARAQANWRHVNFFGGARTAGVEGRWSSLDRGVRLNFQQPYFFSPRTMLTASGEAWYTREPAYTLDTSGARITVQRRFSTGGPRSSGRAISTLSVGLLRNHESYSISNELLEDLTRRDEIIALKLDPRTGAGSGTLSAMEVEYSRNTTGNLLDAQRGYVATLHYQEAAKWLRGDYDYRELTAEGRHYLSVFDRFIWANRIKVGSISGSGDVENLAPFYKRYFLGGSSSLRGWGRFQVSPLSGSGLPIGGHSMLEASTEFRIPVWRNLSLVLFGDVGNVWRNSWDINLDDLRYDVGPGLRYNTPIGPIRLDVGYQLNPIEGLLVQGKEQPRPFRFHFSVGQAF